MGSSWSLVAHRATSDADVYRDPKWAFRWLDLASSLSKLDGEKEKDGVSLIPTNGWAPLERFADPTEFWGFYDKDPPLAGSSLEA